MAFPNMAAWASKKAKKAVDPKKAPAKEPAEVDDEDHEVDSEDEESGEPAPGAKPKAAKGANPFAAFIKRKRGG